MPREDLVAWVALSHLHLLAPITVFRALKVFGSRRRSRSRLRPVPCVSWLPGAYRLRAGSGSRWPVPACVTALGPTFVGAAAKA